MSGLSITICYLSIYGGVVEGGGGGPRAGGAPTTPNQLWGGPACKSLRTPGLIVSTHYRMFHRGDLLLAVKSPSWDVLGYSNSWNVSRPIRNSQIIQLHPSVLSNKIGRASWRAI